jgi:hypothetical protein
MALHPFHVPFTPLPVQKEGGGEPDTKYPYIGFWPDVPKEKSGNWSKQVRRTPPDGEGELIRIFVRKHHPFVSKSDFLFVPHFCPDVPRRNKGELVRKVRRTPPEEKGGGTD